MGNETIVMKFYKWLWITTTRGMFKLKYGRIWMKKVVDDIFDKVI